MKITVKKEHAEKVAELRTGLIKLLRQCNSQAKQIADLTERKSALESEIAELDASDDISDATANKLAARRVQLEKVTRQLEEQENNQSLLQLDPRKHAAIMDLLIDFQKAAMTAIGPALEKYFQEIASAIRPWCIDDKTAFYLAQQTSAGSLLAGAYQTRFRDFGATVRNFQLAIARADEILAGELKWSFDPKMTRGK